MSGTHEGRPVRGARDAAVPGRRAGVPAGPSAVPPELPCVSFVPSSMRRTTVSRGLRRGGATTSLRLP
ncbi:hypothetical protein [Streptomyces anandii]|uniref:hypothetical protein n=1 Tax=Streptomyces anandii TaxID=285454 RepID=UPI003796461A